MQVVGTGQILRFLPIVVLAVAHLAGLVLAIVILVRRRGLAAVLATVAFGLLLLLDVGGILRMALLDVRLARLVEAPGAQLWTIGGFDCCCGLLDVVATTCLIIALWTGIRGSAAGETEESPGSAVPQE